jgi:uncharacterized coiled-coil protein SlyX
MTDSERLSALEERLDLLHGMVEDLSAITTSHQQSIHNIIRTLEAQTRALSILSQMPQV